MTYKEANIVQIEEALPHDGEEMQAEGNFNRVILQTSDDNQQVELEVEQEWLQQMGLGIGMRVHLLIHNDGTAIIQK